MPSSFIREEGYRAVMLMRAGPVGANHKAVLSVSARSMSSRCFFGMPRSTASTFKHSRRSEPIRLDSAGSSFLKFAKSQRSFRNIAKIIIIYDGQEICYEIFFSSSSNVFVSAAAYEEITLTTAMYVFCHFLEFPGISVAQA